MKPLTATTTSNNLTMDSLALPRELYWDVKAEPVSSELFTISESIGHWQYDDNFENEMKIIIEDTLELKPGFEFTHELINDEDLVIKLDEHWTESKLQSPRQLLDYPIGAIISHPTALTKVHNPFDQTTFGSNSFDTAVLTQLTPPHSPPRNVASPAFPNGTDTQYNIPEVQSPTPEPQQADESTGDLHFNNTASISVQNQFGFVALNDAHAIRIVDEIVNNRAKELLDWNDDECESQSSCSAPSQAESIIGEDEDEWMPSSSSDSCSVGDKELSPLSASTSNTSAKKRTRPYGRGVEDRKIRKKEQNKNAATRYRQKKKTEMEEILDEEKSLNERHHELQRQLADREREAKYLKTLIREFYRKKQ